MQAQAELKLMAEAILDVYDAVATGASRGAGGCFFADGQATLNAVVVDVKLLEGLASALGRHVHPRTADYRKSY